MPAQRQAHVARQDAHAHRLAYLVPGITHPQVPAVKGQALDADAVATALREAREEIGLLMTGDGSGGGAHAH